MSLVHGHLPGSPARNGLPLAPFYVYRGLGYDQFTEDLAPARVCHDITAAEGTLYTGYDSAFSEFPGMTGRKPGRNR